MNMNMEKFFDISRSVSVKDKVLNSIELQTKHNKTKSLFKDTSHEPMIITTDKEILNDLSKVEPVTLELLLIHGHISDDDFDLHYKGECTHKLKLRNSIIKFKLDDNKYVDNIIYITESTAYLKRKSGKHKGEFLVLNHHQSFVKEADGAYPGRSARLIMNVGGHGKVRVSSLYHVSNDGRFNIAADEDYMTRYKGKLNINSGNHDLFFISCTDDIDNAKEKSANLNILFDFVSLKFYLPVLKYAYFNWLLVATMKLSEERFMLDKTQLNVVPKLLPKNESLCDLINANMLTRRNRLSATIEVPKNIDMQSVFVPLQRDDIPIHSLMISHGSLYYEKQHEFYNQPFVDETYYLGIEQQYVVSFIYKDKIRVLRVDEDKIELVVFFFATKSLADLNDNYKLDSLSDASISVVEGKATSDRRRLLERKIMKQNDVKKEEIEKNKLKQELRIKHQKERTEINDAISTGYKSTHEKIMDMLNFDIDRTVEDIPIIKVEMSEPSGLILSEVDPSFNPDDNPEKEILKNLEYSDNMVCVANAFKVNRDFSEDTGRQNCRDRRIKTLRALQGKVNAQIVYRSGKVYDSRLRLTTDELVIAEPVKGDTAALIFKYIDVEDCIVNGKVIELISIPHKRKYHTKKGIERLSNDYEFVDNHDLV